MTAALSAWTGTAYTGLLFPALCSRKHPHKAGGTWETQPCQSSFSRASPVLLSSSSFTSISGVSQVLHVGLPSTPAKPHRNNGLIANPDYFFFFNWKSLSYSGSVHRGFFADRWGNGLPRLRAACAAWLHPGATEAQVTRPHAQINQALPRTSLKWHSISPHVNWWFHFCYFLLL